MDAYEFRDYILGFIFYKYLSGKIHFTANKIFTNFEQSTLGTNSEDDFEHLFEDLDLTSSKLGKTEDEKNTLISKVLYHLDDRDFNLSDTNADILGHAHEYVIAQFACGAGKKAREFYIPQQVSTILARIVTSRKSQLKPVYDTTCGSGSLLLRVSREAKVSDFYGQ